MLTGMFLPSLAILRYISLECLRGLLGKRLRGRMLAYFPRMYDN